MQQVPTARRACPHVLPSAKAPVSPGENSPPQYTRQPPWAGAVWLRERTCHGGSEAVRTEGSSRLEDDLECRCVQAFTADQLTCQAGGCAQHTGAGEVSRLVFGKL